jgi:hypothetical protein
MKYFLSLIAAIGMVLSSQAAETNVSALDTAKQVVATNVNQVMLEMLTGVKNASGEIYSFSKQELGNGYDFVKKQAPEVVHEFIVWNIAEACVWILVWSGVAGILFFFARQMKLSAVRGGTYSGDKTAGKWVCRIVACLILVVTFGVNSMTIAKCSLAPRVFIIEYVVDMVKPSPTTHTR